MRFSFRHITLSGSTSAAILMLGALLLCWGCKTAPPEEAPPRPLWPVKEEVFSGLRILHIATPKEVVSIQLFIDGGTGNYRKEKEGIDRLALETAAFGGTSSFSPQAITRRSDSLGIRISTDATLDYSVLSITFLREKFNPAWELFASMVMAPSFNEKTFDEIRDQEVTALKRGSDNQFWHLNRTARANAFAGEAYGHFPAGSEAALEALTARETKAYFKNMMTKNRVLLVVAGPIPVDRIVDKLLFGMDGLPEGSVQAENDSLVTIAQNLSKESLAGFSQYVQGVCAGPQAGTDEAAAFHVAMSLLNDALHQQVSVEQQLIPDITAWYSPTRQNFGWIRYSCKSPNESASGVNGVLKSILSNGFSEAEVERMKKALKTAWLLEREGAAALATRFGAADSRSGWESELGYIAQLELVDKAAVDTVFATWCKQWHWSIQGNTALPDSEFMVPLE